MRRANDVVVSVLLIAACGLGLGCSGDEGQSVSAETDAAASDGAAPVTGQDGASGTTATGGASGVGGKTGAGGSGGAAVKDATTSADVRSGPDGASAPPTEYEEFVPPWTGTTSPSGIWKIAGPWTGTGNNQLLPANAQVVSTADGQSGGFLLLTVTANKLEGGEIQTIGSQFGYGYYEVRMKVTDVPGTCVSFFWKEVQYGPGEIDIEFLTNEPWISSADTGKVHYTIHPGWDVYGTAFAQDLAFNPSKDFHRYGFLWTPEHLDYTVDGAVVKTFTNPPAQNLVNTKGGYIMMNAWTGSADWGGGPPTANATSAYDWVKYYAGATSVPVGD